MENDEHANGPTLHHVALRAADVDATAAFYQRTFGLEIIRDERPRSLWLGLGDGSVLMIEARGPSEPEVPARSLELLALRVAPADKPRLASLARERGCYDGETAHTIYLRDPDGRRVGASTYPLRPQSRRRDG